MSPAAGPAAAPRIAVVGDIALDYYLMLAPQRAGDEKRTAARSFRLLGGTGANAAAAAAVLGSRVTLHSVVGTDHLGQWLAESLASRGVDTRSVQTVPGSTTQATILVDGAARQVIVDRGVADQLGELDLSQIGTADVVYVTGSSAAITRIALAGYRSRVVAGIEAWMADDGRLGPALGNVDLVVTNSAGWTMLALQAVNAPTIIETRGPEGAVIHASPLPDKRIAAIPVDAVDATGAGDCFAGALCHYLASGLELTAACELGAVAAGLSTQAVGAESALPTDAEVRAAAAQRAAPGIRAGEAT